MRVLAVFLLCLFSVLPAAAQAPAVTKHAMGVVTTQAGSVRLPGAAVIVKDASGTSVAEVVAGEDGSFTLPPLGPGKYTVTVTLAGFETTSAPLTIGSAAPRDIAIDLPIEGIAQSVEVTAQGPVQISSEGTIAPSESIGGRELDQFAPSGGLQASLRLLASIIEVPGGVSIKGGRPSQAAVQLGETTLVDPATGLSQLTLPDDAIDSVAVLPNPYGVEYGRFSSGLVVIQTRKAGQQWKVRLNNIDPTFRSTRTNPFDLVGVGWWGPRLEVGGPIVKDRLFLEQTAQFRYNASDVPSLPPDLLRTSHSFSSFTRVDGTFSPRNSFTATGGVFPGVSNDATLGTFTPPAASVNVQQDAQQVTFSERAVWSDNLLTETTFQAHDYKTDVLPQGTAPMQLLPQTTLGNFFNSQHRETGVYQVISSISGSREATGGLHLFKAGVDVLQNTYDGWSESRPVLIDRADGTLARRLDFPATPTMQSVDSTDVALFAQDRFQPNARWYSEFGIRLDRDGVFDRFNLTPRVGAAVLLNDAGTAVIRGGIGLFYERTPSTAGAFDQFASYSDVRYADDGLTPVGLPETFVHRIAPGLQTPRSRTWDISYDYRVDKHWSIHLAGIDREGSHDLIVDPVVTPTLSALTLTSHGRSSYKGAEAGLRFTAGTKADFNVSYARSSAHADLNALTTYFAAIPSPVIGNNQYAPANSDAPNRLFARGRLMPTDRWLLLGIFDWRTGLPYSAVDEDLAFVGARNSLRFPTYLRLETGIERRFKILKFQPWIGVRVWNALNSFLPVDVQSNISSPAFGSFYNSEYRQFRIQIRFER